MHAVFMDINVYALGISFNAEGKFVEEFSKPKLYIHTYVHKSFVYESQNKKKFDCTEALILLTGAFYTLNRVY